MSRKNFNRIAFRLCVAAAFTFLSAGPFTRAVLAAPVMSYAAASVMDDASVSAAPTDAAAGPTFAMEDTYVAHEAQPVAVAPAVRRVRTTSEAMRARYFRVRYRLYRAFHITPPSSGVDPFLMSALGLGLIAAVGFRFYGFVDDSDDQQTA